MRRKNGKISVSRKTHYELGFCQVRFLLGQVFVWVKNMNFLTYEVTLDEFELEVIRKMVEDMPESMSMTIEEGVNFGVMLQIIEQYEKEGLKDNLDFEQKL